ncbi:helix-turn-helix domain-containing protein [Spiroplasma alleghenense]|uniref:XRE family transcriptional regulator n=1 Tax=Spiroplasma alleghenense TaxID=216931 RepID=A0A345Z2C2_9MOLU|nr:helix-turn-helix transcriptional regulator [Spiroplasma alleghenense]AXK50751.1 XRE family transcriptional regulator [Spiroplasma alleghenense]
MKKDNVISILSENMKELRMKANITQEELSFRSGLHRNYISDTERGTRNISIKAVEKIAQGLEVPVEDLFVNKNK